CDTLDSAALADGDEEAARRRQILADGLVQLERQRRIGLRQALQRCSRKAAHPPRAGRLSAHDVLADHAKADVVARVSEIDDAPAAVEKRLVDRDDAFLDAIDVRARIAFAEDVLLGLEPALRCMRQSLVEDPASLRARG